MRRLGAALPVRPKRTCALQTRVKTMSTPARIQSASDFKQSIVNPNYTDHKSDPIDLRHAYHLAVSLFHLRDWTFWEYGSQES